MQRRNFLTGCTAAGIASLAYSPLRAIDAFERPKPGHLKLSLAAYSMRKYLAGNSSPDQSMNLHQFVDFCAKYGLPGGELTSYYFPDEVTHDYLLDLKRHCHLRGVSVSGGAIRNDFCSLDRAKVEADIAHTKLWIDYYSVLGAPAIRIFAGQANDQEPLAKTLKRCAENCQVVCDYAAQKGVILALENHGGVTSRAEGLLEIIEQVDSPAIGVNFDSGNFRSSADPYSELEAIAPYAINAQVKTEITVDGEKGEADLKRIINILKEAGYSGWVALEYEAAEEPTEAIPKYLDQLKTII